MSFRELRDFTEIMKALGYPKIISMENFRTPNFELLADILFWLTQRYDASAVLSDDIGNEAARVAFLKNVAQIMAQKARVKLSVKNLYHADGHAVREVLKICRLLYDAIQTQNLEDDQEQSESAEVNLGSRLSELKEARELATQIVDSGVRIHDLLGGEEELKRSRDAALAFVDDLNKNLESNDPHHHIQRKVRQQIETIEENIKSLTNHCQDLEKDQANLKRKIDRRDTELTRAEKKMTSLKKVRPPFMEEYEHHEEELKQIYEEYLEKFRNLNYLESELGKYHMAEMEKKKESERRLQRMQKQLRLAELRILRGENEVDENDIDGAVFGSDDGSDISGSEHSLSDNEDHFRRQPPRRPQDNPRVRGSMADASDDSDSDDDDSDVFGRSGSSDDAGLLDDSSDGGGSDDDDDFF